MGIPREPVYSQLVVAAFSRYPEALAWAAEQLTPIYGPVAQISLDFSFHHTRYYEATMGPNLVKRFLVFEPFVDPGCLPEVKHCTIELEKTMADSGRFPEARPLNLDPGLLQLGKFLLASTKDQAHRIYLRDNIFAEVTLRFHAGQFEVWPWTYADYQEPAIREFLTQVREELYQRVTQIRSGS